MKTIETIIYKNHTLSVLITADEHDKASVEYFVNGLQITDWSKLKPDFQTMFSALADAECKILCLTKWSY